MCRRQEEKTFIEEGKQSYYKTLSGPGFMVAYFKNKFLNKTIEITQDL